MHRILCAALGCLAACGAAAGPAPAPAVPTPPVDPPAAPIAPPIAPPVATPPEPAVAVGACGSQTLFVGPPVASAVPGAAGGIAAGDVNGDGNVDAILGGVDARGAGQISVLFGKGDGAFVPAVQYPMLAGDTPHSLAVTDFDNDNDLDIITSGGAGTPEVFLNNADGTFGAAQALGGSPRPDPGRVVAAGDLDGDKDADIAEASGDYLTAWFQIDGKFVPAEVPRIPALEHPHGLAIADYDHDGVADLALAGTQGGAATLVVLRGSKRRVFGAPVRSRAGAVRGDAIAIVAGDFDGNGKLDVAALYASPPTGTIVVWSGHGDGTFAATGTLPVADVDADAQLAAADLEPDGRADLVATTTRGLAIYRSTGAQLAAAVLVPASGVRAVVAADLRATHFLALVGLQPGRGAIVWPTACR